MLQVLEYNFEILDKMMSILFGDAYDDKDSYLADCDSLDAMTLVGLVLRRERLIGDVEDDKSSKEAGDESENPTVT